MQNLYSLFIIEPGGKLFCITQFVSDVRGRIIAKGFSKVKHSPNLFGTVPYYPF